MFRLMRLDDLDKLPWGKQTETHHILACLIKRRDQGTNTCIQFPYGQHAIVADDGNGCIAGMISFGIDNEGGYLEWIWVHAHYRTCGLARCLMTRLQNFMRDEECERIVVQSAPITIEFFEKLGYVHIQNVPDGTILMEMILDDCCVGARTTAADPKARRPAGPAGRSDTTRACWYDPTDRTAQPRKPPARELARKGRRGCELGRCRRRRSDRLEPPR